MNNPVVSIIVPCYNQAEYLSEALNSVWVQSYKNWQCIIINDGSTDTTSNIAHEWICKDSRFTYIEQVNKGLSNARNTGLKFSRGEFILPLDSDDKISSNYIEEAVKLFLQIPNLKLVYCKATLFGDENKEWELPSYSFKKLLIENMIFCSAIYRKADVMYIMGYDEELKTGLEDWDLWIRLLSEDALIEQLPFVGFNYRIKHSSMHKDLLHSRQYFNDVKTQIVIKNIKIYEQNFLPINSLLKEYSHLKEFERKIKSTLFYRIFSTLRSSFLK